MPEVLGRLVGAGATVPAVGSDPRPMPDVGHGGRRPTGRGSIAGVPLPLAPPIAPQLARSARLLPTGEQWRYEPKRDGFRIVAFRDGEHVHLQSRGGKPMERYFPEVVAQVAAMPTGRVVLDGEIVICVDGVDEFDLLSQRIHPAASRVALLAEQTPAAYVAFDVLADGDEVLLDTGYDARRERLHALDLGPVDLVPSVADRTAATTWLGGTGEGVVAKESGAPYRPGERRGMVKIKRLRTLDAVVMAYRDGKEPGTVGSLVLGLHDDAGELRVVGFASGFTARQKRELVDRLGPYRTHERGSGEPSRWKPAEELAWEGLRPELVVEVAYDQITGERIRHGAKVLRWREDKAPADCRLADLHDA